MSQSSDSKSRAPASGAPAAFEPQGYRSYLLRIWFECGPGVTRVLLIDPVSENVTAFRDLRSLTNFLAELGDKGQTGKLPEKKAE